MQRLSSLLFDGSHASQWPQLLLVLTATRRSSATCLLQEQLAESLGQHRAREYNVEEDGK